MHSTVLHEAPPHTGGRRFAHGRGNGAGYVWTSVNCLVAPAQGATFRAALRPTALTTVGGSWRGVPCLVDLGAFALHWVGNRITTTILQPLVVGHGAPRGWECRDLGLLLSAAEKKQAHHSAPWKREKELL